MPDTKSTSAWVHGRCTLSRLALATYTDSVAALLATGGAEPAAAGAGAFPPPQATTSAASAPARIMVRMLIGILHVPAAEAPGAIRRPALEAGNPAVRAEIIQERSRDAGVLHRGNAPESLKHTRAIWS